jgi:hypothetical protein
MSQFDKVGSLIDHNARRELTPLEIEQIVRQYRAVVVGEMIADAIIWIGRLPWRLAAALKAPRPTKSVAAAHLPGSATR